MAELAARLSRCFVAVFPDLDPTLVAAASPATVRDWDSLHMLTLIAVIEEEFGIAIPARDYPSLRAYPAALQYITQATGVD